MSELFALILALVLVCHEHRCVHLVRRGNDLGKGVDRVFIFDSSKVVRKVSSSCRGHSAGVRGCSWDSDVWVVVFLEPCVFNCKSIVFSLEKDWHTLVRQSVDMDVPVAEKNQSLVVGADSFTESLQFSVQTLNPDTVIVKGRSVLPDLALIGANLGNERIKLVADVNTSLLILH